MHLKIKKEVMKMDHKEYDQLAETLKPVGHKMGKGIKYLIVAIALFFQLLQ